ncbi:MAG: insulinase family protein [Chloroflexi bacterium]|nr:insulinase family protein [Chloroflexota bacterium]
MYQRTVLDNKLRVLTSTMIHTRSVSMIFCVGAGSRYESEEMAGLSHFIEHLPFKGTKNWPSAGAVSEAIEGVGGILNASTDREMTVFWCKVPHFHFRTAFAVLLDMMLNPLLEPEEVEKEREVIQEELRMTMDMPSYRVDLLIDEALWPNQAMGRDVGGTPESVEQITQESIREYMERQYNPANTVIAVAGNVTHEEVVDLLADATAGWQPKESLEWEPVVEGQSEAVVTLENKRSDQSHLCLAFPALALGHPDRYALTILNIILGDGMSSRLFMNLRERQSLTYDVNSSTSMFRDCGSLVVYCGVEPKKSRKAVRAVVDELGLLREEPPAQEVAKAQEYAKGRLMLRMEDTRAVASWLGSQELLLDSVSTPEDVAERLDSVTPSDVARVARDLLRQDQLRLAVVGPHRGEKGFLNLLKL